MKNKREEIQEEALSIIVKQKRCGLAISMGVGKTLIGLKYIDHFQNSNQRKLKVLVVAPKVSIFDSWRTDAQKFGISLDNIDFTTYLSLNKHNPHNYDLLILDECHSLLNTHHTFLAVYTGRILGLTGTPPRYKNSEKGIMVNEYCPIVYSYITDDAVSDEILNDYRIIVHRMPLSYLNDIEVNIKNKQFYTSEYNNYNYWSNRLFTARNGKDKQMTSIFRMKSLMEYKTKERYAKYLLNEIDQKCIVFCNTQKQAENICNYSVHSNNPDSDKNLEMFKNGDIQKLSCVLQLNEGVNIPNLESGIIMHSYGNERKSSQRIGRLLRLNPNETAMVHILCYKDTVDEQWVSEALKDLDSNKIKYFDVKIPENNESSLYR